MGLKIYQVDAFTDRPFAGNPAAVCVLPDARNDQWMQNVAMEMNISETAFLVKQSDGYDLRWFTPAVEVELCGHATLASAHTLWETGLLLPGEEARFHTKSGLLTARQTEGWIELNFPARPETQTQPSADLVKAVGMTPVYCGRSVYDFLIEAESEDVVRNLNPDFGLMKKADICGVMVTSIATMPGYDFVSRFFAPGAGIDEDPVTGSAHCTLGPFWQRKTGKKEFLAYQASKRGGTVRIRIEGDRVRLGGQAVTTMSADLTDICS